MEMLAVGIVGWASGIVTAVGFAVFYFKDPSAPVAKRQGVIGFKQGGR